MVADQGRPEGGFRIQDSVTLCAFNLHFVRKSLISIGLGGRSIRALSKFISSAPDQSHQKLVKKTFNVPDSEFDKA